MKLEGRLCDINDVTDSQRDQMFALMERNYLGMRRDVFENDLDEKQWVIQLVDAQAGDIYGFSTQMVFEAPLQGRTIKALFSGDTIIDPRFWGNNNLIQVWGRLALALIDTTADAFFPGELYWFLISKGYKTYRYLPVFFHEFFPRFDIDTPPDARAVIDALASTKYPDQYDFKMGVIRAQEREACRLREGVAEVTPARLADPHVRFFEEHNPGHARGDELCCIAPLTRPNFTRAAYRAIGPEPVLPGVSACL